MTTALQLFQFETNEIRGGIMDGEPVLCAKDVAEALGFQNAPDAIKKHCKGVALHYPLKTSGGIQNVRFLREPDVYRLVLRANTPDAEKFQDWICEEVLPQLRRTGMFMMAGELLPEVAELVSLEYRIAAVKKRLEARELDCKARLVYRLDGAVAIGVWLREYFPKMSDRQLANETRSIKRAIINQLRRPCGIVRGNGNKVISALPADIQAAVELLKTTRKGLK